MSTQAVEVGRKHDNYWKSCTYPQVGFTESGIVIRFTAYGHGKVIINNTQKGRHVDYTSRSWRMSVMIPRERTVEW